MEKFEHILLAILFAPIFLYLGFFFYASAIQRWSYLNLFDKIFVGLGIAFFAVFDILFNFTFGTLYYRDLNFLHGNSWKIPSTWTFSVRTSYWYNQTGTNKKLADIIADQLNRVVPGHIH